MQISAINVPKDRLITIVPRLYKETNKPFRYTFMHCMLLVNLHTQAWRSIPQPYLKTLSVGPARVELTTTSLWINSLCFNSGKIFNIIFLVENKDNILQRWSPPWIGGFYKQLIIACEWLFFFPRQMNRWFKLMNIPKLQISRFSILDYTILMFTLFIVQRSRAG